MVNCREFASGTVQCMVREKIVFNCLETPSIFHQSLSNMEENITAIQGVT